MKSDFLEKLKGNGPWNTTAISKASGMSLPHWGKVFADAKIAPTKKVGKASFWSRDQIIAAIESHSERFKDKPSTTLNEAKMAKLEQEVVRLRRMNELAAGRLVEWDWVVVRFEQYVAELREIINQQVKNELPSMFVKGETRVNRAIAKAFLDNDLYPALRKLSEKFEK